MTVRPNVDAGRLVNLAITICVVLFVASLWSMGSFFAVFVVAAAGGALIGLAVARLRPQGLRATEVGERAPEFAGKVGLINMAHIPVMGIGGLGIVAMSFVVALFLPEGRRLMAWSVTGAVLGAGTLLIWRHFHGGSPFDEHPEETLHLR